MNKSVLKEDRHHGDLMFPLNVYINNPLNENTHLDLHWHSEMEFLILKEGKAVFQIEDRHYELTAGQAIFINSEELHAGFAVTECVFDAIVFSPTILFSYNFDLIQEKFIKPLANKQIILTPIFRGESDYEHQVIKELNKVIDHYKDKSYAYELVAKSALFTIFSEAFINQSIVVTDMKESNNNYKLERLKKILNYIYLNFDKNLNLTQLSQQFSMSEGHFCRFFKEMTHKTPIEFINNYRINQAAKILVNTDEKISQVALDTGFDNIGYFISTFKKQLKCTPSEYRKLNNKVS